VLRPRDIFPASRRSPPDLRGASTCSIYAEGLALVVDEPERVEDEIVRAGYELRAAYEESQDHVLPPPSVLFVAEGAVLTALLRSTLVFRELDTGESGADALQVAWPSRRARSFAGRVADFAAALKDAGAAGDQVHCVMRAPGSAARLAEILATYELRATIAVAGLREGFEFPEQKLTVYSEREIFGEEKHVPERKSKSRTAFLSDFRDLKVGDLVVHVDHGVARYAGLGRPKGGSLNRDFMILEFQGGDRLFVPTDRLDLVQKYSGVSGHQPRLDKLGGVGWEKVKSKVRKSVESMAKELLELYARRRAATGHAFAADGPWQAELEAAFPFELTGDQARAVREVKDDLEQGKPMDRLLVGDVGFGKTEVAVRAAFKVVMDGKQVAVWLRRRCWRRSTSRRSRSASPLSREARDGLTLPDGRRYAQGAPQPGRREVDLVVGTHRLLSKDVAFKNLGLLVVDEEQRFGVAAKERLKQLSIGDRRAFDDGNADPAHAADVAGRRARSVRHRDTSTRALRDPDVPGAVPEKRGGAGDPPGMRRQGQVFFVHNRVETIPALVRALTEMVPEARIVVAHGQMPERELEKVMLRFTHDEADMLVTTTLIENGLDIPRANTIIVNRADRLGLAQLYQLRGRVGRSELHAYAYFLIPGRQTLSDTARRRLKALQEFSDLGSGFRLAAADLEIRGAGEFLGSRQHGHIASLGFDLYCTMLEQAVATLRGEPVKERTPVSLHLAIDIKLPESYMADVGDRLALYKRLSVAGDAMHVDRLQTETEDRWGQLPPAGRNLFDLARLRLAAERAGVTSVDLVDAGLKVRFSEAAAVDPRRLVDLVARRRGTMTPSGVLTLPAPDTSGERIAAVRAILDDAMAV
jgi:transcription-repair coupling factor (superfamily II helicase)